MDAAKGPSHLDFGVKWELPYRRFSSQSASWSGYLLAGCDSQPGGMLIVKSSNFIPCLGLYCRPGDQVVALERMHLYQCL